MSATTAQRPTTISFHTPQDSLRQAALKKNMSITQTYYLAHKARAKLSREAAQPDHDLRLLVGHANLLDTLMVELADAEREQERWFNQSVRGASTQKERHVKFTEQIVEEEEYDSDSSDEEYDEDKEDIVMVNTPATPLETEDDLEEDYEELGLVRTSSHANSPPELVDEYDSSEDESMPPSPPQPTVGLSNSGKEEKTEGEEQQEQSQQMLYDETYYLPRNTPASLFSAITVY
jgi:hypothetical protein